MNSLEQFKPVHACHMDSNQRDAGTLTLVKLECLFPAGGRQYGVAFTLEVIGKSL